MDRKKEGKMDEWIDGRNASILVFIFVLLLFSTLLFSSPFSPLPLSMIYEAKGKIFGDKEKSSFLPSFLHS